MQQQLLLPQVSTAEEKSNATRCRGPTDFRFQDSGHFSVESVTYTYIHSEHHPADFAPAAG